MIYINNLSINNDTNSLNINVSTNTGALITSILLWNENTFKDYSVAIDLTDRLEQVNNNEIFTVTVSDININSFSGIWFLEITSNSNEDINCNPCQNSIIGIAANLNSIKSYILDKILELQDCNGCRNYGNDLDNVNNLYLINKGICMALQLGYYEEAVFLYKKIQRLIHSEVDCTTCRKFRSPSYNNSLNFGILDNNLILI